MVDAGERLQVLLTQEATNYRTCDYLSRMQGLAKAQEIAIETATAAAAQAEQQEKEQQQQSSSSSSLSDCAPSSPKKRKSWDDLTSVEVSDSSQYTEQCRPSPSSPKKRKSWDDLTSLAEPDSSQHTEQCRRTAATAYASCAGANSVGSAASSTSHINKHWREKICEWAYQVVDHFDLNREVVSTAMSHLDRFLGSYNGTVDKNLFQLLAMTCLYLSIKLNEYKHLLIPGSKSSMETIVQLSRGVFTLQEMEQMESNVLQQLRWHVHPPTPQIFIKHFLIFLSVEDVELHDHAQFMIELSVMDYFFVSYKPSEIAIAALLNSMDRLGRTNQITFPFSSQFLDINSPAVCACRERLSLIHTQANEQGGVEAPVPEVTPERPQEEALFEVPVPEPLPLQRTISPISVMAPPEPDEDYKPESQANDTMDIGPDDYVNSDVGYGLYH